MATVVTPQVFSQSAMASKSQVLVPKRRTPSGSLGSGLLKPAGTSVAATDTKCVAACTSTPAACACVIFRSSTGVEVRNALPERGVMTLSSLGTMVMGYTKAVSAGVRKSSRLPNGDNRRSRVGATNEVIASSRDQAQQRVDNTRD